MNRSLKLGTKEGSNLKELIKKGREESEYVEQQGLEKKAVKLRVRTPKKKSLLELGNVIKYSDILNKSNFY